MLPVTNMGKMGRNDEFNTAPLKVIIVWNQLHLGNASNAKTKEKLVNWKLRVNFDELLKHCLQALPCSYNGVFFAVSFPKGCCFVSFMFSQLIAINLCLITFFLQPGAGGRALLMPQGSPWVHCSGTWATSGIFQQNQPVEIGVQAFSCRKCISIRV